MKSKSCVSIAFSALLVAFCSILPSTGCGVDQEKEDPALPLEMPAVPNSMRLPAGHEVYLVLEVEDGAQIYTCIKPAEDKPPIWQLFGPRAVLRNALYNVGEHYAGVNAPPSPEYDDTREPGPYWRMGDTWVHASPMPVAKVQVDPTAAPWLLLQVLNTSGRGFFAQSEGSFVTRYETVEGLVLPDETCTSQTYGESFGIVCCTAATVGVQVKKWYGTRYAFSKQCGAQ